MEDRANIKDMGPDPPSLGRLFASLGGDLRGTYPRINIILALLEDSNNAGVPVNQLAARVGLSVSATSQHLKRLESDSLVKGRRSGREILYSLDGGSLYEIVPLMRRVFPSLFDSTDSTDLPALSNPSDANKRQIQNKGEQA